ncbi:hypothetical protein Cgig2_019874 [Carnegiea gigantea]|uniref:X8 domain-containing protein n=1 Tax=Carnegiea gigantea TaxID=171969 RepID=A0A9Q1QJY3_9CARY|nr:hypothetical protein Cgig2_019874 [Carnegiea gigantea]
MRAAGTTCSLPKLAAHSEVDSRLTGIYRCEAISARIECENEGNWKDKKFQVVFAPTVGDGQSRCPPWCVAKPDASDDVIQAALNWVCENGADCGPITPLGPCHADGNLKKLASYAFNDYFQMVRSAGGHCMFPNGVGDAAATLTNIDTNQIKHALDEDMRRNYMEMNPPREALVKHKELKKGGNFQTKAFRSAINRYDKSLQYMCTPILDNEDNVDLMEEFGISISLKIATCWLKLKEFELAKRQCDMVLKFENSNVNACFRRGQALLNAGIMEDAH